MAVAAGVAVCRCRSSRPAPATQCAHHQSRYGVRPAASCASRSTSTGLGFRSARIGSPSPSIGLGSAGAAAAAAALPLLPLPLSFLPFPGEKAPMSIGVGGKPAEPLKALVQVIISWRKSAQLRVHEHVSVDGTLWSFGESDPDAKDFRENLFRLLLVFLDHAFPQERPVLKVSRHVSVEKLLELIRSSLMGPRLAALYQLRSSLCISKGVRSSITRRSALDLLIIKSIQYNWRDAAAWSRLINMFEFGDCRSVSTKSTSSSTKGTEAPAQTRKTVKHSNHFSSSPWNSFGLSSNFVSNLLHELLRLLNRQSHVVP